MRGSFAAFSWLNEACSKWGHLAKFGYCHCVECGSRTNIMKGYGVHLLRNDFVVFLCDNGFWYDGCA
ncbi:unnamed protein product [Lathyrus sativus]|nr:unnamed protein product [Lathyrus sativus]